MPERPKPTTPLIIDLTGGDYGLVSAAYQGLHETPSLKQAYPLLDFAELIAIAASSRVSRNLNDAEFRRLVDEGNVCSLIENAKLRGLGWIKKHSLFEKIRLALHVPDGKEARRESLYQKLNPFNGEEFADRVTQIPMAVQDKLLEQFRKMPAVFSYEFFAAKTKRAADPLVEVVTLTHPFPYFPKKGRCQEDFANGIRAKLDNYSTDYILAPPYEGRPPERNIAAPASSSNSSDAPKKASLASRIASGGQMLLF